MFLNRFNLFSIFFHLILFGFLIKSFDSKKINKEKKFTNIINSEIIGLIDQNSLKISEVKDEIKKSSEVKLNHQRMKDLNFEEIEKSLENSPPIEESKKEPIKQKISEKNKESPQIIEENQKKTQVDQNKLNEIKDNSTEKLKPIIQKKIQEENKNENAKKSNPKQPANQAGKKNIDHKQKQEEKKVVQELQNQLKKAEKALMNEKKSQIINTSNQFGEREMASLGAFIKTKIIQCWSVPPSIGIINEQKIYVVLEIKIDKTGKITNIKTINDSQFFHNEYFEKIKKSAIEATEKCSPIQGLPLERFDDWKEVQLVFDPSKL